MAVITGQPLAERASLKDLEDFPSCRLLLWMVLALMAEDCTQVEATGSAKTGLGLQTFGLRKGYMGSHLSVGLESL